MSDYHHRKISKLMNLVCIGNSLYYLKEEEEKIQLVKNSYSEKTSKYKEDKIEFILIDIQKLPLQDSTNWQLKEQSKKLKMILHFEKIDKRTRKTIVPIYDYSKHNYIRLSPAPTVPTNWVHFLEFIFEIESQRITRFHRRSQRNFFSLLIFFFVDFLIFVEVLSKREQQQEEEEGYF